MVRQGPDDDRQPALGVLPPWLWLWLVTYVIGLPNLIALSLPSLNSLLQYRSMPPDVSGTAVESLLRLTSIAELVPRISVAAGVLAIFLPWARAASLERRFGLTDPPPGVKAVDEIAAFVRRYAPVALLKVNLLRTDQLAFVYPTGYRRATMALFGGMVRLWRADRTAAEAVLLHEVGHIRHADVLVVGVGSLFEGVVRRWVLIVLVSFLAPALAVSIDQMIRFVRESAALGIATSDLVTHELVQWLALFVPSLIAQSLSLLLGAASAFLLPLGATWLSEINADRFASETMRSPDALVRATNRLTVRVSWWRWVLLRMSHPPNRIRRFFARHGERTTVIGVALVLYPLAYLARLIVLLAYNAVNLAVSGVGAGQAAGALARGIRSYTVAVTPLWIAMAACVLLWPWLATHWERYFGGAQSAGRPLRVSVYAAAAFGLGLLLGVSRLVL